MIRFRITSFEAEANRRAPGYRKAVLSRAEVVGDFLRMSSDDYRQVRRAFSSATVYDPVSLAPSLSTKARRLALALVKWAGAGFPITPLLQRRHRRAICHACPAYDRQGNAGLGACRDPRCGCTSLKRWLPTERCPQNKWPA